MKKIFAPLLVVAAARGHEITKMGPEQCAPFRHRNAPRSDPLLSRNYDVGRKLATGIRSLSTSLVERDVNRFMALRLPLSRAGNGNLLKPRRLIGPPTLMANRVENALSILQSQIVVLLRNLPAKQAHTRISPRFCMRKGAIR